MHCLESSRTRLLGVPNCKACMTGKMVLAVTSHEFKVCDLKVAVSNPRALACLDIKVHLESSRPQSLVHFSRLTFQRLAVAVQCPHQDWWRVGFCQGNFNSDNCLAGGRTMDPPRDCC